MRWELILVIALLICSFGALLTVQDAAKLIKERKPKPVIFGFLFGLTIGGGAFFFAYLYILMFCRQISAFP
jgi:hypothetical protein